MKRRNYHNFYNLMKDLEMSNTYLFKHQGILDFFLSLEDFFLMAFLNYYKMFLKDRSTDFNNVI